MSLSTAPPVASAEECGEGLRPLRVASDVTPADIVERFKGSSGVDQMSLIVRHLATQ